MNPYIIPAIATFLAICLFAGNFYGFTKAKTKLGKIFSSTLGVLFLLLSAASAFVLVSKEAKISLGLISKTETLNYKDKKKFVADDGPEADVYKNAPVKQEASYWMEKAKTAIEETKKPEKAQKLQLVKNLFESTASWLISYNQPRGNTAYWTLVLKLPETVTKENNENLRQMAQLVAKTSMLPNTLISVNRIEALDFIFIGKKEGDDKTIVLAVNQIYRRGGKTVAYQENYMDPVFEKENPFNTYKEMPYFEGLEQALTDISPEFVDSVELPKTYHNKIIVEFTIPTNKTPEEAVTIIREETSKIKAMLLERYKYVPSILIRIKQNQKQLLTAIFYRSSDPQNTIYFLNGQSDLAKAINPKEAIAMEKRIAKREKELKGGLKPKIPVLTSDKIKAIQAERAAADNKPQVDKNPGQRAPKNAVPAIPKPAPKQPLPAPKINPGPQKKPVAPGSVVPGN
jgi:hypothetical protein